MSSFKELLTESFQKEYAYRVKIAADCSAEHLDIIEACLQKYNIVSAAPFKRTPIQENPMEFNRMKGVKFVSEVCSTDVVLKYPINPRILEVWLGVHLGVDHDRVLCYDIKEARAAEAEAAAERVANDKDRSVTEEDALLAEEEYEDVSDVAADELYGEGFNKKFLDELAKVKAEKGADYFSNYPTKDEIMGDDLRAMWDDLHHGVNGGRGQESTKHVDMTSQSLGH